MASCERKKIFKKQLCRGDLRTTIKIVTRTLSPAKMNDISGQETFVDLIVGIQCGIETTEGNSKFDKININEKATHLFYVLHSSIYDDVEVNNHMIEHLGEYYRILQITNDNETNQYIFFQCTNRGDITLNAAKA